NQVVADPTFAPKNFDPTQIAALTSKLAVGSLTAEQQCLLGSFYASAVGTCGAVLVEQNGNDYHDNDPKTVAPVDVEAGMFLALFLA
ncbi:hypothetical protein, partial [Sulfitobacter dubius]|uniref:hypothetical protein n=1 Tax=Sulfitobacter dubius TaxID=218673 RepID=UPI0022AFC7C1